MCFLRWHIYQAICVGGVRARRVAWTWLDYALT